MITNEEELYENKKQEQELLGKQAKCFLIRQHIWHNEMSTINKNWKYRVKICSECGYFDQITITEQPTGRNHVIIFNYDNNYNPE